MSRLTLRLPESLHQNAAAGHHRPASISPSRPRGIRRFFPLAAWLAWLAAAQLPLSVLAEGAGGQTAPGPPEMWTLTVDATTTAEFQGASSTETVHGTAELTIDGDQALTGQGTMSIEQLLTHAATGLRNELSGSGAFQVVGRREGDFLVFTFKGTIPLSGTSFVPQLGTLPADGSFDASAVAREQRIERAEGATAAARVSGTAGAQADVGTRFRLSGGRNVAPAPAVAAGTFPERPNPWSLELLLEQDMNVRLGGIDQTVRLRLDGSLDFPRPWADGPAVGSGPLKGSMTVTRRAPVAGTATETLTGTLRLDGRIQDGVLVFVPRADLQQATMDESSGAHVRYSGPQGYGLFTSDDAVRVPAEDGAESVQTVPMTGVPGATGNTTVTWRLRGKKRQLWKVAVESREFAFTNFRGSAGLAAGLWARVLTEFDVELEDGHVVGGKGTRKIVSLTSESVPPGVWNAQPATILVNHANAPWIRQPKISSVVGDVGPGNVLAVSVPVTDMGLAWTITLNEGEAAAKFPPDVYRRLSRRFTNSDIYGLPSYWEFQLVSPVQKVIRDERNYKETLRAHRVH